MALLSLPFLFVLVARPVERRLAFRYPLRRPIEALLVILGCLLGTAIITGSLVVGDTLDRSIRASAYDQLGPIDELVSVTGLEGAEQLRAELGDFTHPDADGVLLFITAPAAVASGGRMVVEPSDRPRHEASLSILSGYHVVTTDCPSDWK